MALAALALAPEADAATASIAGSVLSYVAAPGEGNSAAIGFTDPAGSYQISDGWPVTAGAGCVATQSPYVVTCPTAGVTQIEADLGDHNDTLYVNTGSSTVPFSIQGGADNDTLSGGAGNDTLNGGPGDDFISGTGTGSDVLNGGDGLDTVSFNLEGSGAPVTVSLDDVANDGLSGQGENAGSDLERVLGGNGNDTITGSDHDEELDGGFGTDTVNGAGGNDTFHGNELLFGDGDVMNGGDGNDRFYTIGGVTANGDGGDDTLVDEEWSNGGVGADTFNGGSGIDTVDFSARVVKGGISGPFTIPISVDLDGAIGDDGYESEGDTIGADVENVIGSAGDDAITGNGLSNDLAGGDGNDVLSGLGANDRLDGGGGTDALSGGGGRDLADYSAEIFDVAVSVGAGAGDDGGPGEGDTVGSDIEDVVAGSGNDTLVGTPADNMLDGGAGDDQLDGGGGADELLGGPGVDLADYSTRSAPIVVVLGGAAGGDGEQGEGDTVGADVEDVWGGSGNDALTGSDADNLLYGGDGADVLTGGGGFDFADYSDRLAAVTVSLDGVANDGNSADGPDGVRDNVHVDMDSVIAGAGPDVLIGSPGSNLLAGGGGDDKIDGGAAEDLLAGEGGADKIAARDGEEDFVFCGTESDSAEVDSIDDTDACESVLLPSTGTAAGLPPGPQAAVDLIPPHAAILINARQTLGSFLRRGLRLVINCTEDCALNARLLLTASDAKRLGIAAAKPVVIAKAHSRIRPAGPAPLQLRVARRYHKALKRARVVKLTVAIVVTDGAGNKTRISKAVRLRRGAARSLASELYSYRRHNLAARSGL